MNIDVLHEIEWADLKVIGHWLIEASDVEFIWQRANTIPDGAQRWANELRRRNRGGVVNDTPAGSGLPE